VAARGRLAALPITNDHLAAVAALSVEHQLDGIRGDLAIIKAARALAAWQDAREICDDHIRRAADLALPHRMRQRKSKPRAPTSLRPPEQDPRPPEEDPRPPEQNRGPAARADAARATDQVPADQALSGPAPADESRRVQFAPPDSTRGPVRLVTDAIDREGVGRRGTESSGAQRVIGAVPFEYTGTLAIPQTLAAAARRGARAGEQGVRLAASDLMQHERRGAGLCHVLFLVDASGSMATKRRLEAAKGAALGLLTSNYQRRDEVALMVFRAEGTDLVLPFTRRIASIERALRDVPTGGRTPLARALLDAARLMQTREPALLVLLTDGRANVSLDGGDPWEEALAACAQLETVCAAALVVDCEPGPIVLGRARVLAQALGAECIALDAMDATALTLRIHGRLESL
jgi:magnesium chelatase subunit D